MSYITCPVCGGGVPGAPCKCYTAPRVAPVQPIPDWSGPVVQRHEFEALKREVEALRARLDAKERP